MALTKKEVTTGIDKADNQVFVRMPDGSGFKAPWQSMKSIAMAVLSKCAEAETNEQYKTLIADGTLLHSAGVPIGLSNDPRIKEEILKESQWGAGRRVPRAGGIPSGEVVSTPAIIKHKRGLN